MVEDRRGHGATDSSNQTKQNNKTNKHVQLVIMATCAICKKSGLQSYFEHNERRYCQSCFHCNQCSTSFGAGDQIYTTKSSCNMYCKACFESSFAPKCARCERPIVGPTKSIEALGKVYHEKCFRCSSCNAALGRRFLSAPGDDGGGGGGDLSASN